MAVKLSVVIGSLNGAEGVKRCLLALANQTIAPNIEVIVVDDGSSDSTSTVARDHGAIVIRHPHNRGISAARNTGMHAATADIIAFLDDDCEPEPQWAAEILAGYENDVIGVTGPINVAAPRGYMADYLERHNPLQPLEQSLVMSTGQLSRLGRYLQRQWSVKEPQGQRRVSSFAGANMSFRREVLLAIGGHDESFIFGAEDEDVCRRALGLCTDGYLVFCTKARVTHHFESTVRDTLRRSRLYGQGSAHLFLKWPSVSPVVFPAPFVVLAAMVGAACAPRFLGAALGLPQLCYPAGLRRVLTGNGMACLLDAYLRVAQETCENVGFVEGLWRYRKTVPEKHQEHVDRMHSREQQWH